MESTTKSNEKDIRDKLRQQKEQHEQDTAAEGHSTLLRWIAADSVAYRDLVLYANTDPYEAFGPDVEDWIDEQVRDGELLGDDETRCAFRAGLARAAQETLASL